VTATALPTEQDWSFPAELATPTAATCSQTQSCRGAVSTVTSEKNHQFVAVEKTCRTLWVSLAIFTSLQEHQKEAEEARSSAPYSLN